MRRTQSYRTVRAEAIDRRQPTRCSAAPGVLAGLVLIAVGTSGVAAGSYTFTKLADTSGAIQQFLGSGAALNDNGEVAVLAALDNGEYAIVRADGSEETIIASTPQFFSFGDMPDINGAGLVAFPASVILDENPRPGVYTGDGQTITVIGPPNLDPYGANYAFYELNASGLVMMAELASNSVSTGVALGNGGPVAHLYDGAHFNQNDTLAAGDLTDTGLATVIAGPGPGLPWYLFMGTTGGALPICVVGIEEFDGGLGALAVNNDGVVMFVATHYTEPTGYQTGVYLWTGGAAGCDANPDDDYVEVAHSSGPFDLFDTWGGPAINDSMHIAFRATHDAGGHGIYTGPDPIADRVIVSGDALDGAVADYVAMNRFGLNGDGQIAFHAVLSDGRQGIYLATPTRCTADVNGDETVNVFDLLAILAAWGPCPGCPEDVTGDGTVNVFDLLAILAAWGPCP